MAEKFGMLTARHSSGLENSFEKLSFYFLISENLKSPNFRFLLFTFLCIFMQIIFNFTF